MDDRVIQVFKLINQVMHEVYYRSNGTREWINAWQQIPLVEVSLNMVAEGDYDRALDCMKQSVADMNDPS